MEADPPHDDLNRLDAATSARLAKLRSMPVDVSRVERLLRDQLPALTPRYNWLRIRPLRAVAASILILLILGVGFFAISARPVRASAPELSAIHRELVSGAGALSEPISIDEANKRLAANSGDHGIVALPIVSDCEVMACCKRSLGRKRMSCAMVERGGAKMSMIVARAADVRAPQDSSTVTRDGVTYHVQSDNGLNMVMTERNARWLCVMGEEPTEKLIEVAAEMKF
jgi:hypothetical protein